MISKTARVVGIATVSLVAAATLIAQVVTTPATQPAEPTAAATVNPNEPVVTFDGQQITAGEFDAFINILPPQTQFMARGPAKRQLAQELVKLKLLASQARARNLDQTPQFKQQMELMRDNILVGVLLQQLQEQLVTEEQARQYYEQHQNEYERFIARHILVSTRGEGENALSDEQAKAKAEELRKRIGEGNEDFAAVAKAESADPGSKDEGGELPAFSRGMMVPEFQQAVETLKEGEISQPVKTPFGYHIIKLEKKEIRPFDQVKDEITDDLRREAFDQYVDKLQENAKITYNEAFFGGATTAPAQEPAQPAEAQ